MRMACVTFISQLIKEVLICFKCSKDASIISKLKMVNKSGNSYYSKINYNQSIPTTDTDDTLSRLRAEMWKWISKLHSLQISAIRFHLRRTRHINFTGLIISLLPEVNVVASEENDTVGICRVTPYISRRKCPKVKATEVWAVITMDVMGYEMNT